MNPALSVQIVTWNSARVIDACLESLARQRDRRFEVVVVDNASTDGSAERVACWRPSLPATTLIRAPRNLGFCGGQNRATATSSGDLVLFLNPDAALPPDFVARALAVAAAAPARVGAFAPCILLPDGRIDSTGLTIDRLRRAYDRDHGAPAGRRERAEPRVFGCTGAVALLRRSMLLDVAVGGEVLDECLFAYYDDLDLAWRAALRGWACRYESTLTASHERAGRNALRPKDGRPPRRRDQALSVRNRLLVIARCDRGRDLLVALPFLVAFELARAARLAVRAPGALHGYVEAVRALPSAVRARPSIHGRALAPLVPLPWRAS